MRRKLGETRDLRLGQAASAIEVYRDMLDVDPGNAAARAALERKLDDKEHRGVAAAVLEPIYEQLGDWAQLVLVQEIKVGPSNPSTRAALLLRIGELYRLRLGNAKRRPMPTAVVSSKNLATRSPSKSLNRWRICSMAAGRTMPRCSRNR